MCGTSKMLSAVLVPQIKNEFKLEGAQKTCNKSNRTGRGVSCKGSQEAECVSSLNPKIKK